MKPTQKLHDVGQSLWLDNITRELLNSGTLKRYIDDLSVTGLTSNPTIFDNAIKNSTMYDEDVSRSASTAKSAEDLFFPLALADLTRAADLFHPVFARTDGVDGWVSLEVSPLLAHDTKSTLAAAVDLHKRAGKPNLFIKIPGTTEGLPAIEEAIFADVPVNVTLLFSSEQYVAAAEAYMRGVERRIAAGLNPAVASVAVAVRTVPGEKLPEAFTLNVALPDASVVTLAKPINVAPSKVEASAVKTSMRSAVSGFELIVPEMVCPPFASGVTAVISG